MNKSSLKGQEYRSPFTLYSADGKRAAEVLEFRNGETYLDEQEWIERLRSFDRSLSKDTSSHQIICHRTC
jgi:hypothetical protein